MVTTQFSRDNLIRYEAREEGFVDAIVNMLRSGGSEDQAKQFLHATPEQIEKAKQICFA